MVKRREISGLSTTWLLGIVCIIHDSLVTEKRVTKRKRKRKLGKKNRIDLKQREISGNLTIDKRKFCFDLDSKKYKATHVVQRQ